MGVPIFGTLSFLSRRAHLFTTDKIGGDTARFAGASTGKGGRRRALTQRARQIRYRSFAVNSDSFVNYKTMYQSALIHNGIFNTLSEFVLKPIPDSF